MTNTNHRIRHSFMPMVQGVATIVIAAALIWIVNGVSDLTARLTSMEATLISSTKIITLERRIEMSELEARVSILKERSEAMGEEVTDLQSQFKRIGLVASDKNTAE